VLHALDREQPFGKRLHAGGRAAHRQHLHAGVVLEVDVHGGDDELAMVVLDAGEQRLEVALVVVVDQGHRASDLPRARLGQVFHQPLPHQRSDGVRAVAVALGVRERVEPADEIGLHRDAEPLQ